jgi:hypothetical protein
MIATVTISSRRVKPACRRTDSAYRR